MEGYIFIILLFIILFIYNFLKSFLKVIIFKYSTGITGSVFKMTILYMLSRSELEDLHKGCK